MSGAGPFGGTMPSFCTAKRSPKKTLKMLLHSGHVACTESGFCAKMFSVNHLPKK